jgi:hypothetical protein
VASAGATSGEAAAAAKRYFLPLTMHINPRPPSQVDRIGPLTLHTQSANWPESQGVVLGLTASLRCKW